MMRPLSLPCSANFTIPDHRNPCLFSFEWNAASLIGLRLNNSPT